MQISADHTVVHAGVATVEIRFTPAPPRTIALVALPVLNVAFWFSGAEPGAYREFIAYFDLYTKRGGGWLGIISFQPVFDRPMEAANGMIPLPTEPGFGFDFNSDTLVRHGKTGWQPTGTWSTCAPPPSLLLSRRPTIRRSSTSFWLLAMSPSVPANRILITGAAGYLGTVLRTGLAARYPSLRLTDIALLRDAPAPGEEYVQADLRNPTELAPVMRDVDVVVHLGGCSLEAPWATIFGANIVGTVNVFEAARQAGVRRIVYASSHHVVGYYRRDRRVGPDEPPRPDSRYGISKVFGEAVGRMYADKYGMSVICQRIGVARPEPQNVRGLVAYQSERDYVHLTERCIEAMDVHFLVVYGISANTGVYWNNPGGDAIGYKPVDDGTAFSAQVHARQRPEDEPPLERLFQGGWFCGMEFAGDPDRID